MVNMIHALTRSQGFGLHDGLASASCGTAVCSLPTNSSGSTSTGRCETCATLVMQVPWALRMVRYWDDSYVSWNVHVGIDGY